MTDDNLIDNINHDLGITFEPKYDFGLAERETDNSVFVQNLYTKLGPDEASQALAKGYRVVVGKGADKKLLALLIGQAALETGNFRSMHNYNFGNVRGEAPDGRWTSFEAGEIIGGKEVILGVGEHNKFRAYPDAVSGATDYVRLLRSRPNWWNGLQSRTVEGFAAGLSSYPAYFTASPTLYAKVLEERKDKYLALADKYGATGLAVIATSAAAAIAGYLGYKRYKGTA